jgi:hypothetical protein
VFSTTSSNVASAVAGEVTTGPGTVVGGGDVVAMVVVVVAAVVVAAAMVLVVVGGDVVVGATVAATVVAGVVVVGGDVLVGASVVVSSMDVAGATASVTCGGPATEVAGADSAGRATSGFAKPCAGSGYDDSGNVGSEVATSAIDAGSAGGAIVDAVAASASDRPLAPPDAHQMAAATRRKASAITKPTMTNRPVRSSSQCPRSNRGSGRVNTGTICVSAGGRSSLTRRLYHCHRALKPSDPPPHTVHIRALRVEAFGLVCPGEVRVPTA